MIDIVEILLHLYAGRSQNELATSADDRDSDLSARHQAHRFLPGAPKPATRHPPDVDPGGDPPSGS